MVFLTTNISSRVDGRSSFQEPALMYAWNDGSDSPMNAIVTTFRQQTSAILDWVADQITAEFHEDFWRIDRKQLRSDLDLFMQCHADKSPEELAKMAQRLSPGGAHTAGLLVRYVMEDVFAPDPTLVAALLYHNWKGGKRGFQFLPDPAKISLPDYREQAAALGSYFDEIQPTQILLNDYKDVAFYNSLPEHLTVYRGGGGCSPEALAAGMCWTTSRPVAEWFANRCSRTEPILLSARMHKSWVRLAFADEYEVVLTPFRWRQLKCPTRDISKWRPAMEWAPQNEPCSQRVENPFCTTAINALEG